MQLITAPQNEAIMSNVAEIGEFRIRNSAKAFNILSSGLYANKIKAIIRELSCNAVDSHVAAGKGNTPFDVHLPTQLEPHFAIRDYGTGLTHDQVTNIYTTYFESTKTNSNDFIGALGLGSKSPFSYTDNFTVTAIKDGIKGIYSAFINDAGVPSIAKMSEEETTEPAGVEVKFSVNDSWDFSKFYHEAVAVYKWFKLRPVVSGPTNFQFDNTSYKEENVIPGVHIAAQRRSIAVMGNIAYPIEMPTGVDLGGLEHILECGLVMEFGIGELDFQASREGLSYIPETVAAIKRKLEAVNAVLVDKVKDEADAYKNLWDRAAFLENRARISLYTAAVKSYVTATKFPLLSVDDYYIRAGNLARSVEHLRKKYNITVRAFEKSRNNPTCSSLKEYSDFENNTRVLKWEFKVSHGTHFIINDTKVGAVERSKYHWRNTTLDYTNASTHVVYVLDAANSTKPMRTEAFLKSLHNPPKDRVLNVSSLLKKERNTATTTLGKNVTILHLESKGYGGYYTSREKVWRDAGKADSFDSSKTYYYLPLSGFTVVSKYGISGASHFNEQLAASGIMSLQNISFYGVRKGDIEYIQTQPNWVNVEDYVAEQIGKLTEADVAGTVAKSIDLWRAMRYNQDVLDMIDPNSDYAKFISTAGRAEHCGGDISTANSLLRKFNSDIDLYALVPKYSVESGAIKTKYPLLQHLGYANASDIAHYVNLVENQKGN